MPNNRKAMHDPLDRSRSSANRKHSCGIFGLLTWFSNVLDGNEMHKLIHYSVVVKPRKMWLQMWWCLRFFLFQLQLLCHWPRFFSNVFENSLQSPLLFLCFRLSFLFRMIIPIKLLIISRSKTVSEFNSQYSNAHFLTFAFDELSKLSLIQINRKSQKKSLSILSGFLARNWHRHTPNATIKLNSFLIFELETKYLWGALKTRPFQTATVSHMIVKRTHNGPSSSTTQNNNNEFPFGKVG